MRRKGRIGLITAALGLVLAAGVATPAVATGNTGPLDKPQPLSKADRNTGGANGQCPGGPYCSTRDGSPSQNGNGKGASTGKPCAGCVGKADNKNPRGQMPNGSDHNNGYECDGNHGIGRGNPAHTGCETVVYPPKDNPPKGDNPKDNPPKGDNPKDNPPVDNPPVDNLPADDNLPVDNLPADDNLGDVSTPLDPEGSTEAPRVLGASLDAPQAGQGNPLPTGAAAGEASTDGQLLAGVFAAFAAFLAFGSGVVLRRRDGDA